jgi:hypothetical protein
MSQVQDELEISETGNRIAEPRLDAQALPPLPNDSTTFSVRDETTGLLVITAFAYFIANIAVGQILRGRTGDAGMAFSLATVGSQWILVSIWLGLGNWPLPWRLLATMFAVAAQLLMMFDANGPPDFWTAVWGGSLMVIATSLPFGVFKLFGFRLVRLAAPAERPDVHPAQEHDSASQRPPAIQFSVRNLLSWTASAGIVAALIRDVLPFNGPVVETLLIIMAATTAMGGTSIWATLSNKGAWPRILAPLGVSLLIAMIFGVSGAPSDTIGVFFSATMLASAAIMIVLLLFRRLGWRIAFRPPVAAAKHEVPLE